MINGFLNRVLTKMLGPSPLLNSKNPADRARARRALTRRDVARGPAADAPMYYSGVWYQPSEATLALRRFVDAIYGDDRARYVTYDDGSWYGDEEDLT